MGLTVHDQVVTLWFNWTWFLWGFLALFVIITLSRHMFKR